MAISLLLNNLVSGPFTVNPLLKRPLCSTGHGYQSCRVIPFIEGSTSNFKLIFKKYLTVKQDNSLNIIK
jgi:hypothetical protein